MGANLHLRRYHTIFGRLCKLLHHPLVIHSTPNEGSCFEIADILTTGHKIDCVLADYRLQDNETGTTVIRQVCKALSRPGLPAIIISGDTEPARMQAIAKDGFEALHKPIKPAQLRGLMNHLLKPSQQQ